MSKNTNRNTALFMGIPSPKFTDNGTAANGDENTNSVFKMHHECPTDFGLDSDRQKESTKQLNSPKGVRTPIRLPSQQHKVRCY